MLTVSEAFTAILKHVKRFEPVTLPLEQTLGLTLAEDIVSGVDSPPFDKALMDGFAVRSADLTTLPASLTVIEEVTAGRVPERVIAAGQSIRIMTGAPIPVGADAVVPIEETEWGGPAQGTVKITANVVRPEQHLLRRGAAVHQGEKLLAKGRMLRAQEIAALAELGKAVVNVFPRPNVGVLATGDELVSVGDVPGPGQIRNTNEPMLLAQVQQAGGIPVSVGIARDRRDDLRQKIEEGLKCDILLLSGGVSAGKLDLVPSELEAAGVQQVFHKIQMKPGKPLWFGVKEASNKSQHRCYVFGLPGNPVSSMVCCELFARTAIRKLMGEEPAAASPLQAKLRQSYEMRGQRPTYHPARLEWEVDGPTVYAVDWIGSSDVCATVDANAMVLFPPGDRIYQTGELLDVWPL